MIAWFKKNAPIRRKFAVLIATTGALGCSNVLSTVLVMQSVASPM